MGPCDVLFTWRQTNTNKSFYTKLNIKLSIYNSIIVNPFVLKMYPVVIFVYRKSLVLLKLQQIATVY